jgi:hypothetical protein
MKDARYYKLKATLAERDLEIKEIRKKARELRVIKLKRCMPGVRNNIERLRECKHCKDGVGYCESMKKLQSILGEEKK